MPYRTAEDILTEASANGWRRAFVVTALLLEMDAVRAHVRHLGSVVGRDGNVYECGVFEDLGQGWLVVIAETGAGTHPAQSVVTYAHIMFGEFEVQLLVGIGGSRKPDAPVGSVVASDHVYMPYSGKYAEAGRSGRPRTFQVDGRLLGVARKVRRDRSWPVRIRDPLGASLPPFSDYPAALPPAALVAPIASVEAVSADPSSELEALIAREYGDTCIVEMEGYGAVHGASIERTPSIVIRGVSDMTANKEPGSDAVLQPIAACHAAAFGFELLSHWGQLYPRPSPAPIPTIPPPQSAVDASAPSTSNDPSVDLLTSRLVVNLDLDATEVTPERLAELEAVLRRAAGSETIRIVHQEPGSLRLIVEDPAGALAKVEVGTLKRFLAEEAAAPVLGVVNEAEYAELRNLQEELEIASGDLSSWPRTLPDGAWIERPELERLLSIIDENSRSTTALLGPPGSGKSSLMAALTQKCTARGWPVLAVKADLLDPEISTPEQLQGALGLPEPPGVILQRMARLRPVVLIIDQLDALAAHLDLRTGRLNALLNLVRRVGRIDNVHVVLSSRTFEFQHDVRLRTVSADSLTLELPAWSQVLRLLEARGVEADGWPADAQDVMRYPQALATYLGLESRSVSEPFASYQAMLERLWSERVLAGSDGPARARLASDVADAMARDERLWLARARFEDRAPQVDALVRAGVLTPHSSEGSVGFTHQTLFEFALARGFARERGRLSGYVLERQSSLFVRPKLWAALTYLRAVDPGAYQHELEAIWRQEDLRPHLRRLLIDFLGQQAAPVDHEAELIEEALGRPAERAAAFRAVSGSPGWFERLWSTQVRGAMGEGGAGSDLMIGVLTPAWSFASERVTQLLGDVWLPDPAHDPRIWIVLQAAAEWTDDMLAIGRVVVKRTEIAPYALDHVAATVGMAQPRVALQLLRARLDQELADAAVEAAKRAGVTPPTFSGLDERVAWSWKNDPKKPLKQLLESKHEYESLPALAERWPRVFLAEMWPWYLAVFHCLRQVAGERGGLLGYALQEDADYRFSEESGHGLPEPALLAAVRSAAEQLAAEEPEGFLEWAQAQSEVDAAPVHRLVAHVFTENMPGLAQAALEYLLADQRRFHLGSIADMTGTTKRLITAASSHWSEAELARVEQTILAYAPPPPPDRDAQARGMWRRAVRRVQLDLLRALPNHRTSARTQRRIDEELRVFPEESFGVRFSGVRTIGALMRAGEIARASDADVLNAFRTLPDITGWSHPANWDVGGNIQLAREFATFAKAHPERARRLIAQFEPAFGTRAAGYALEALAETDDPEAVLDVLLDLSRRGFDGTEYRNFTSRAVERLVRRRARIGDQVVSLLESWLSLPPPDAVPSESDDGADAEGVGEGGEIDTGRPGDSDPSATTSEQDPVQRSVLWGFGGLTIIPGGDYPVLEALVRVRLARGEPAALIDALLAAVERGGDYRSWDSLLDVLSGLPAMTPDRRVELLEKIFARFPQIKGSKAAAQLLAHVQWWSTDFVRGQLERWPGMATSKGRRGYGELVALVSIAQPSVDWATAKLQEIVEAGPPEAREGAALSAANLWTGAEHREAATDLLTALIPLREPGVWAAVFDVFRLVDELVPDPATVRLLEAVATHLSEAPSLSATFVVERLQSLLPNEAELVARTALGLASLWRGELSDMRTAHALAAPELVDLAVTLHRLGGPTRELGTRLFEELVAMEAYSAQQTLDEIDSRFRSGPAGMRARLPRRSARARRGRRPAPQESAA